MKALVVLMFLAACSASFAQTFQIEYVLTTSASGSNIGSNGKEVTNATGLSSGQQGYVSMIASGAGGGIDYPPGSSNYSSTQSIQWSVQCTVIGISEIPTSLQYTQTLSDYCSAEAETLEETGNAVGSSSAGEGSYEENAYMSASGYDDIPGSDDSPTATQTSTATINSPNFQEVGDTGYYQYTIMLDSDSIDTSAETSQGESAAADAYSEMVVSITGFSPS